MQNAKLKAKIKKQKGAVALKYEVEKDYAPRLVAKGRGLLAQKIIEKAQKYNVPIYEDENLLEALLPLDLGELIPPYLYRLVAEVLAWVYRLEGEFSKKFKNKAL